MTWKQFFILAAWANILVIGGLWVVGIVSGGLPPNQNFARTTLISFLAVPVITGTLFISVYIYLFAKAKWKGDIVPFSSGVKLVLYAFIISALIFIISGIGWYTESSTDFFYGPTLIGFIFTAFFGLILCIFLLDEITDFQPIKSAKHLE
ncbi:MAG: hypothetical protein COB08_018400 [Rhodobacteraceae bacterium]|nr:hypothetical protein [Paracoccaceae bacterium]